MHATVIKNKSVTWLNYFPLFSEKCVVPVPHTEAFFKVLPLKGWGTLFWTCRGVRGSAEAVHYPPLKHRPEGPKGPSPIIQTGHLTPLPSLDYWSIFCRQYSFTERTRADSGTHLLIFQLLFIILPSWAQNLTWPRGKPRHTVVSVSLAKHVGRNMKGVWAENSWVIILYYCHFLF